MVLKDIHKFPDTPSFTWAESSDLLLVNGVKQK